METHFRSTAIGVALVLLAQGRAASPAAAAAANSAPAEILTPGLGGTNRSPGAALQIDFRNAPVDSVLDQLSASAHLVIHKEAEVRGAIDLQTKEPVNVDGAIDLLNSALKRLGCAAILDGRVLTVVSLEASKTSDLEVVTGGDPALVSKSDQIVTQIIPVRYANANQLINNLQPLLPSTASLSVNESANSLILVATKTQVRRMLRIVSAIDTSLARVSSVKVVPLKFADAKELASVVQQLFSSNTGSATTSGPFGFPGGFGPPGAGGAPGGSSGSDDAASSTAASKVTAVADELSNSLILSAAPDRLSTLLQLVRQIDQPVSDITEIRVFTLQHADPTELADELAELFSDGSNKRNEDQSQNNSGLQFTGGGPGGANGTGVQTGTPAGAGGGPAGFAGGPGGFGGGPGGAPSGGGANTDSTTGSARSLKMNQVLAVPDPRTSSLVVSATGSLMPQVAKMIEQLDASGARREYVQVYDLHNADPQDVNQILQDLFSRSSSSRNNNNNDRTSLLGQGNPLTSRATQQQSGTSSQNSGVGNSGGRTGAGGQGTSGGGF